MANISQLEKLIHLQKIFASEDSLESAVTIERLERLILKTEQLIRQRSFMREERRLLRLASAKVDDYNLALKTLAKPEWFNSNILVNNRPTTKRIMINVGGLMFETTEAILMRDEGSLLARLCQTPPPIEPDPEGFFIFDRDWWLFRYILMFLRDGNLPNDEQALAQLYREANFWKLKSLQRAIEEEKLHLPTTSPSPIKNEWWKKCPSWWEMAPPPTPAPPPPPEDWWKSEVYNGKKYSYKDMPK